MVLEHFAVSLYLAWRGFVIVEDLDVYFETLSSQPIKTLIYFLEVLTGDAVLVSVLPHPVSMIYSQYPFLHRFIDVTYTGAPGGTSVLYQWLVGLLLLVGYQYVLKSSAFH